MHPNIKKNTEKKHEDREDTINRTQKKGYKSQRVLHSRGTAEDMQTLRLQQASDTDLNRLCARHWHWGHVGGIFEKNEPFGPHHLYLMPLNVSECKL